MKAVYGGVIVLALAAGLAGTLAGRGAVAAGAPANPGPDPVALVNGQPISRAEFEKPVIEAYGLKVLLYQIQLKLAQQEARDRKLNVTDADYAAELDRTLKAGFGDAPKEDYPALLEQLLEKKGVSRAEFDMVLQVNAILRKIAEPELKDVITEEKLKEAFNQVYGENVILRHIQCANPQEAMQAKTRLAAGEAFETLVQTMSRNARTREIAGELPPFSRQTERWPGTWGKVPQGFKDWAFSDGRKIGDVSDPIAADDAYHILKLATKTEPKVVKYDDVKASLKARLQEQLVERGVAELRAQLGAKARQTMVIKDPTLREQFDKKVAEQTKAAEAEKARQDLLNKAKPTTTTNGNSSPDVKTGDTVPGTIAPGVVVPAVPGRSNPAANPPGTPAAGNPPAQQASPANAPTGERPPASKSAGPANLSGQPADGSKSK